MQQVDLSEMQGIAGKEKVMTVLMGPVEVRQSFRDWPLDMCLAVCLMENGDCQLVVFQQEEAELFPQRLEEHLGVAAEDLCFFPAVPGYRSRTLLYSDEQRLIALVAEAPEIVEEASDYSVNYAYALDEGLNPAVFLGIEATGARPAPDAAPETDETSSDTAFVSRRAQLEPPEQGAATRTDRVRKALLPGFMQRTELTQPGARFRSARELAMSDEYPVLCRIWPEENGWILVAQTDGGGADIRIGDPDLIYLRDDHSVVAIRLEPPWDMSAALPGRIWIRARSLPPSLRAVFSGCAGAAEMTGNGAFLYLNVKAQAAPMWPAWAGEAATADPEEMPEAVADAADADAVEAPVALVPQGRKRSIRRRLLALTGVAAALVLIQLGMQLGAQGGPGRMGAQTPIDWDLFRSAWQSSRAG